MRTIGLLGGMSPASTVPCYQRINALVNARAGALHSAPMLIYSFDFESIVALQKAGRWDLAGARLADCGRTLVQAGAQAVVLGCTEIGLLVRAEDSAVPLLDTTELHAAAAARFVLGDT